MNTAGYPYFIYGKVAGSRDSGYRLVAHTANTPTEAELAPLLQTHSFWGDRPPSGQRQAVGIFPYQNKLVLVKAEIATENNGQPVLSGCRNFDQFRYIFLALEDVDSGLNGFTFELLDWTFQHPIPIYSSLTEDLAPLPIPLLEQGAAQVDAAIVERVQHSLNQMNVQGSPLLLQALSILVHGQRLLLVANEAIKDFWRSLLLLLPSRCRSQVSIALGTLEEQYCSWAQLLVKANGTPRGGLPSGLIYLNNDTKTFEGQFQPELLQSDYTDLLAAICQESDAIPVLLQTLNEIDTDIPLDRLTQPRLHPEVALRLIRCLPAAQREAQWQRFLTQLDEAQWRSLIDQINPKDEQELAFAWSQVRNLAIQQPQSLLSLLAQLWDCFSEAAKLRILENLSQTPELALGLIGYGLIERSGSDPETAAVKQAWRTVCQKIVADRAQQNPVQAWKLAIELVEHQIFQAGTDRFWVLDAALANGFALKYLDDWFNSHFAPLLVDLNAVSIRSSHLYQHLKAKNKRTTELIDRLLQEREAGLSLLPELATATAMNEPQRDRLYVACLNHWQPSFETARPLLVGLLEQWLVAGGMQTETLSNTVTWFEGHKPELRQILADLKESSTWEKLYRLACVVDPAPLETVEFLDKVVGNGDRFASFRVPVMRLWLGVNANHDVDRQTHEELVFNSKVWQLLQLGELQALVHHQPQQAARLVGQLVEEQRYKWIGGSLLHQLAVQWSQTNQVDEQVLSALTDAEITNHFSHVDWMSLARLCWLPGVQQKPQKRPEGLTEAEREQLIAYAKEMVRRYTDSDYTKRLLDDCLTWGLDKTAQIQILQEAQPSACTVSLVLRYLYNSNREVITPPNPELVRLLLQIAPATEQDQQDYKQYLVDLLLRQMEQNQNPDGLQPLLAHADRSLYAEAVYIAAEQWIGHRFLDTWIKDYTRFSQHLQEGEVAALKQAMLKPLGRAIGVGHS